MSPNLSMSLIQSLNNSSSKGQKRGGQESIALRRRAESRPIQRKMSTTVRDLLAVARGLSTWMSLRRMLMLSREVATRRSPSWCRLPREVQLSQTKQG